VALRHVENDYLQGLCESGLWGMAGVWVWIGLWGVNIFRGARTGLFRDGVAEAGLVAALGALAFHSSLDFPIQIPALLFLAAALAGLLRGSAARFRGEDFPACTSGRVGKLVMLGVSLWVGAGAVGQLVSFGYWQTALREADPGKRLGLIEASLGWWPWEWKRQVGALRTSAEVVRAAELGTRSELWEPHRRTMQRYLGWRRLDWQSRLELLAHDAEFRRDVESLREAAQLVLRINPRNARLHLEAGRILGLRDARSAAEILRRAPKTAALQQEFLDLGWKLEGNSDRLWELILPGVEGLKALAEFAFERSLPGLASLALERIPDGEVDWEWKCAGWLRAGQPELAARSVPKDGGLRGEYWRSRALVAQRRAVEAWKAMDRVLKETSRAEGLAGSGFEELTLLERSADWWERWKRGPRDVTLARIVAGWLVANASRAESASQIREITTAYPTDLAVLRSEYDYWVNRNDGERAVAASLKWVEIWMSRPDPSARKR